MILAMITTIKRQITAIRSDGFNLRNLVLNRRNLRQAFN